MSDQQLFTVRDATHQVLRTYNMTTMFGNPGSTEMHFFKNWPEDMTYIMGLQEAAVVAMADGYAQATRNAAVVNLHSAAGLGNALGNVFTAYRNQTPLVIIAGQQSRAMFQTEPFLFADQAPSFPKPYVKWSCEPARPENVPAALVRAYQLAMQPPRGPVFLSIPADDWEVPSDHVEVRHVEGNMVANPRALDQIAEAINTSKHPALVVGPAVDRDSAWNTVVALAEKARCKVWASPRSHRGSFPEDHPYFAGFLPFDRKQLTAALEGHDVIVVIGAPVFTYHVHSDGRYIPEGSKLYQLTDDPDQAARAVTGTSVLGSFPASIEQLLEQVESNDRTEPKGRTAPAEPPALTPLSAEFVMHTLAKRLPAGAAIVEEAPSHRHAMHHHLPIRHEESFFTGASGGLGWAMPAAVGISLANRKRSVVCLVGDGSSMYSVQALWTAAQHQLPITFVVMNNRGYGAMKGFSKMLSVTNAPSFDLPGLDIPTIANGYGCDSARIQTPDELLSGLDQAVRSGKPTLLDVQLGASEPTFA